MVNGNNVELDVPAKMINNRVLVPTRFIAESLGTSVEWDAYSKTVAIKSNSIKTKYGDRDFCENKIPELTDENIMQRASIDYLRSDIFEKTMQ